MSKESSEYKFCNHHHELTNEHQLVDFGDGQFVANVAAIPLLKALNELGLKTRTHHLSKNDDWAFVSILLGPDVEVSVRTVQENAADRTKYNGMSELLVSWKLPK